MAQLILRRGDPSRRRDDDNDVLEDGKVVGRICKVQVAPQDRPGIWASGHSADRISRAAHGFGETREAAMAAFARKGLQWELEEAVHVDHRACLPDPARGLHNVSL